MTNAPRTPKEAVYDEHISPLMAQIIALCKEHRINMAAQFSLDVGPNIDDEDAEDAPLFCTTVLPIDESDTEGHARMMTLRGVMYPRPFFAAFTITTGTRTP